MAVNRAYIIGEIVNGMLANLGVAPSAEQLAAIVNTAESIANPIADEIEAYIGGGGGLNWRGTYSGQAVYQIDDVVYYNGSSYVCIQAATGILPTTPTHWELLAQAGQDGNDGDDGVSPNLTIGTVTTGAAGSNAAASITGTFPNLLLNLTLPRGLQGPAGIIPIWKDTNNGTVITNTLTQSITYSREIPGGTFVPGDVIRVTYRILKTGTAGTLTGRLLINTTDTVSGAVAIVGAGAGNFRYVQLQAHLIIKSPTQTEIAFTNAARITDIVQTNELAVTVNINWTLAQRFLFTGQLGAATDACFGSYYTIEKL